MKRDLIDKARYVQRIDYKLEVYGKSDCFFIYEKPIGKAILQTEIPEEKLLSLDNPTPEEPIQT